MLTEWQVGWLIGQELMSSAMFLQLPASLECMRGWVEARDDIWDAWGVEERLATSESSLPLS